MDASTGQQQYRPGAVSAHGPIHHRSRGMFSRYRPCYWAHVHPATLVVFDGREDFLRWGLENREGRGDGVTSNLVDMQDGSVRACLNLDPTGAVRRREKAERRRKKEERFRKKNENMVQHISGNTLDHFFMSFLRFILRPYHQEINYEH